MPQKSRNKSAEHRPKDDAIRSADHDSVARSEIMSFFISVLLLFVAAFFASIALTVWQKGGYANALIALWWFVAAYLVLGLGALVTYYAYVIKPAKLISERTPVKQAAERRPELSIEKVYIKTLKAGKPDTIIMEVRNHGKVTARNVTLYSTLVHQPSGSDSFLVYSKKPPDVTGDLAPGALWTMDFRSDWINTAADIEGINSGKVVIFHFGKGHYADESGATYPLEYCFMYEPPEPYLQICPSRYRPKEGEPPQLSNQARPRVYVERALMSPLVAGRPKTVVLQLKNGGSETAHKITTWVNHQMVEASFGGPLDLSTAVQAEARPKCQPDAIISLSVTTAAITSQGEIAALNARKKLWFYFGKGTYEDEIGKNVYPFDFCYLYDPALVPNMAISPERYCPKDDKS